MDTMLSTRHRGAPRPAARCGRLGGVRLETGRLVLRRIGAADLDVLVELNADPEVMRYIGDGRPLDRAQTVGRLAGMEAHWERHGFGIFAVDVRGDGVTGGEPAGWVGLAIPTFLPEVLPAVEIGWRLFRRCWGSGIATEAALAVRRFAFEDVGLPELVSIRHVDNTASGRVMEKLGFSFDRTTTVPDDGQPVSVWRLAATDVPT